VHFVPEGSSDTELQAVSPDLVKAAPARRMWLAVLLAVLVIVGVLVARWLRS